MSVIEVDGTLRPSNAIRWGPDACPGSFALEQLYPEDTESEKARQGTAAHFYATEAIQGRVVTVGTLAPNGYPIDQEMIEAGQHFISEVLAERITMSPDAVEATETLVTMHDLIHRDNEGTPDWYTADSARKRIKVIDFKYGHRPHKAFRHWQLIDYAVGVVESLGLTFEEIWNWEIILVIVQPRDYGAEPVKEWTLTGSDLAGYAKRLLTAAIIAKRPNAPLRTGEHCRDCDARHVCPALREVGLHAIDIAGESTPHELDNVAIGMELTLIDTAMKRLEARRTGLQEVAISKIQGGDPIKGWTMGRGDTREKWLVDVAQVFALGELMGVDLQKPPEPITPAQARKAGVDATVIKAYADKPQGAVKLIPASEASAAKAFG